MPPTDHYDEDSDEEGERDRKRYLKLGYAVAGVPRNKRHADRLKRQGLDEAAPASQQKATKSSDPVAPLESSERATGGELSLAKTQVRLYSESEKSGRPMEATFDTGTAKNWLSEGAVAQLKYRIEEVQPVLYSTFTGQTVECSKIIRDVKLCIATKQGSGNKSTWTDFRVAPPNAPFEVLFGREFIHAEEIFNFKEAALILVKSEEAAEAKKSRERNRAKVEEEGQRLAGLRQAAVAAQKETEKGTEKGTEKAKHRHRSSSRKKDKDGAAK